MTFVSYAQNFEDVMLWRALSHVSRGFYIDIGAQDPVHDSVSLAFYEHQWRGVHIEPTEQYSSKLRLARPDEVIEQVAIGAGAESLEFYEFSDTGLSTSDDAIAKLHLDSGYQAIRRVVPVMSLDTLLEKYRDHAVNWMKIDVEGLEKNVIESWVESPIRPWILVIESTLPLSQEQSHDDWESLILAKGYRFAYFDGLNRFYVHEAHGELLKAFNRPPNVFDGFVLGGKASHSFYQLVQSRVIQAETLRASEEAMRKSVEAELASVYASTSWRLTQPLRWLMFQIRLARQLGVKTRLKTAVKKVLAVSFLKVSLFLSARPVLRSKCVGLLKAIGVYESARKAFNYISKSAIAKRAKAPLSEQHLTGRGRDLYRLLKKSAGQRSEGQ
ncbi:Methyltransf_21 domain-containing protein [Pseudomonas sp. IT-P171]|uniref:FkbM family methyltransferase n=1 Tax=Pseudomonas sp. IT-P171 TaxID=3026453 RepID=UPI0039E0469C